MYVSLSQNAICLQVLKEGTGFPGTGVQATVSRATWLLGTKPWDSRSSPNY